MFEVICRIYSYERKINAQVRKKLNIYILSEVEARIGGGERGAQGFGGET
jgi:hypothetical protein